MNELLKVNYIWDTTGNANHNHCVKADPRDPLPFCYTTDRNVRWEYCDCEDNSGFDPRAINPINPFGSGGKQDCATVSTTIKGIVNLHFVISGHESDRFHRSYIRRFSLAIYLLHNN